MLSLPFRSLAGPRWPLLLALLCVLPAGRAQTGLKIATIEDRRPSVLAAQRVLQTAYGRLDIPIEFVATPVKRFTAEAEAGALDGIAVSLSPDPQSQLRQVKVAITHEEVVVYSAGVHFQVKGYASLQPYLIGAVHGLRHLKNQLPDARVEAAPNIASLFRKLAAGRTDIALDSRASLCLVRQLGLKQIYILEPAVSQPAGYHYLHPKHQQLIPRLEAVLHKMEADGEIREIYQRALQEYLDQCKD